MHIRLAPFPTGKGKRGIWEWKTFARKNGKIFLLQKRIFDLVPFRGFVHFMSACNGNPQSNKVLFQFCNKSTLDITYWNSFKPQKSTKVKLLYYWHDHVVISASGRQAGGMPLPGLSSIGKTLLTPSSSIFHSSLSLVHMWNYRITKKVYLTRTRYIIGMEYHVMCMQLARYIRSTKVSIIKDNANFRVFLQSGFLEFGFPIIWCL